MPLYSYSRIGCFENCPRQYKFRYIEKPPIEAPEGVEAFMGKMVHETLEECHRLASFDRPLSESELLSVYERIWTEKLPANLKIVKENLTADDYFRAGLKALRNYHARHYPFDQELTLGLERNVIIPLDEGGQYKLTGFVDRIARDGSGRLRIHDYKTSATLPTQADMNADRQLPLYQIAVEVMWPDNNGIELVWHYLRYDTTFLSSRTSEQLDRLKQEYIGKIKRIEAATELGNFPTNETNLCHWCDYYDLCPAKGGKGAPDESRQIATTEIAPEVVALKVDAYIALDAEKKELEAKLAEIREVLVGQGRSGTSTLLRGSGDKAVTVSLHQAVKLPTRSADLAAFEMIERLIKEAGLHPAYSSLDIGRVQKGIEEGALPESLAAGLKPLQQTVVQSMIRIKRGQG